MHNIESWVLLYAIALAICSWRLGWLKGGVVWKNWLSTFWEDPKKIYWFLSLIVTTVWFVLGFFVPEIRVTIL